MQGIRLTFARIPRGKSATRAASSIAIIHLRGTLVLIWGRKTKGEAIKQDSPGNFAGLLPFELVALYSDKVVSSQLSATSYQFAEF